MKPSDSKQPQDSMQPFMPFAPDAEVVAWSTGKFMLDAEQERYLCFASTLEDDRMVNAYASQNAPFVHHLILARTSAPEPEGFAECDVAFRNTWEPLFITGTGNSVLEFPEDAGHQLTKGTQLVVQMHLLNASDHPVEGSVTINMRRTTVAEPAAGQQLHLRHGRGRAAAQADLSSRGTCPSFQPVQLIAGFPHMHMLGTSMRFEVGSADSALHEIFKRDPFDFNNQHIDMVDATINPGEVTRVTCTFDNPMDKTIGYGESTHDEMCYFVGLRRRFPAQSACLEVLPPNIFGR